VTGTGSLYVDSWTVTIDNCYDQVSDRVSDQYVGTALARSEQWVTAQWWQGEGWGVTYLCSVSVDSHSSVPVEPTDQIFTVLSMLPLASLPSLLHATDVTL